MSARAISTLLYRRHRHDLITYANGIVRDRDRAEDIVQDAWERIDAVERAQRLEQPLRYLYRIVRNLALDGHRKRMRDIAGPIYNADRVVESIADDAPSPEADAIARDELRRVIDSMNELPDRTRRALLMHAVDGAKMREIAERMQISIGLAHKLVSQGKAYCAQQVDWRG